MKTLKLAEHLSLPLDTVTEKLAWLGRTGSGKTYGAMKLAELMLKAGAQVGALDPVGVWRALRVPSEKGGTSFEVVVFGGLYGDLPLEPTTAAGELIADLVCERGLSFVLDVSQFIPAEQQRFVRAFADRFFHRKKSAPSAVHLFMEECQEFIPENPSGDEAKTLGVMQRLWKLGRNFGIGGSLLSQRPQEIAKKALNMSGTMFAFQMTGPQERKAVKLWVADKGIAVDIESVLQKLDVGQPHVESPMFLDVSKTVRILPRVTADLSSTPKVGASTAARRPLTPIDVEQLKTSMSATIEKAKADDPRELKKQVARLQQQLAAAQRVTPQSPASIKTVEKFVLKDGQLARLEKIHERMFEKSNEFLEGMSALWSKHAEEAKAILRVLRVVTVTPPVTPATVHPITSRQPVADSLANRSTAPARASMPARSTVQANGDGAIAPVQQRILDALAELEQLGSGRPPRELVAFLAGYTHLQSKGFVNAVSALRTAGFIDYPSGGEVVLTEMGRAVAHPPDRPRSAEELQARIIDMLGGASGRILAPLIAAYPHAVSRQAVAEAANYGHLQSKGFVNAISRLRTLGFVDYPDRGSIIAKPVLFLEG